MPHEDYHQSIPGKDGEEPIEALGSPPQTDMNPYYSSGPPTDLADTASLEGDCNAPAKVLQAVTTGR